MLSSLSSDFQLEKCFFFAEMCVANCSYKTKVFTEVDFVEFSIVFPSFRKIHFCKKKPRIPRRSLQSTNKNFAFFHYSFPPLETLFAVSSKFSLDNYISLK